MQNNLAQKLSDLGIEIPEMSPPVANYVPVVISGNMAYVSGQLPLIGKTIQYPGKLGASISDEDGVKSAELCALNIIAQLKAAGVLNKITRCVKLTGLVNSTEDYTKHPMIINGASDFMVKILGENGKHARAAFGVSSLPLGASVEVEAIFELK